MIYPPTTFKGQEVSICNRYLRLFRDEHNAHPDGELARIFCSQLNALIPFKYHDSTIIFLSTIWKWVLLEIPEGERSIADAKFQEALYQDKKFKKWQRNHYKVTIAQLMRERRIAKGATRLDNKHKPSLSSFSMVNGKRKMDMPSKNPNLNESTNYAFAERFLHLHPDAPEDYIEAANEAIAEAKNQGYESKHWDPELDMEAVRLSVDMPEPPDPPEDYDTYTLTQTAGKVAKSSTQIDFTGYDRGDDGIVYKQGFNFGDFSHFVNIQLTASSPAAGTAYPFVAWAISNTVGTRKQLVDSSAKFLELLYATGAGSNFLVIREEPLAGEIDRYTFTPGPYFTHYVIVGRASTTATCDIYGDLNHTIVLDNLSGGVGVDAYDTVYGFQALGDTVTGNTVTGRCFGLDLQIPPTFNPAWARNSNQIIGSGVL